MTALELQKDLAEEIRELCSDMKFKTPKGSYSKLNMFRQNLPMRKIERKPDLEDAYLDEDQEEEMEDPFPYCIVKLDSGKSEGATDAHVVKTVIMLGIYDDSVEADGYQTILNIFEDIRARFRKNQILKGKYVARNEITWALADEDEETFPYFFGAMYMEWEIAEYGREDRYS